MMKKQWNNGIKEEHRGINIQNEGSLHNQIKQWYAQKEDRLEVKVGRYIVDIVRQNQLIEIQTKNFSSIRSKIKNLIIDYPVRLVYPICEEKWIVTLGRDGEVISRRKSPKKGKLLDCFNELIRCPEVMNEENFSLEILMIKAEEIRCFDGKGSWRRKGASIYDKILLDVSQSIVFESKDDFASFLPDHLPQPFTNKSLSKYLDISIPQARRMTYCLKKMKLIREVGKQGNTILYEINTSND
ncbi:hypothetical protein GND95_02575 [Defluviitalea raffinosedens]|uniref:DUF8091 domain-containing protein n=2 Tax=Defluviitalea raffinosedens TaxID=1450156 RepID=A0A7C8HGK1_9FIRM|nr:hypothetical protein [Defluviitalea raffinosedens]KAE9637335.1 hypothetical protein GND95_02575 [Defluviitalea raffinosedens]HHW66629.1 hypothetical protein [Candidatus Epulonipiscium sp.]